jgi:hypothetical protein
VWDLNLQTPTNFIDLQKIAIALFTPEALVLSVLPYSETN